MKLILLAAIAAMAAVPATAQTTSAATPATPAAPAAGATTATAPAGKFSLETPIETIAADNAAKAVLEGAIPGITSHPAYEQFKAMNLKQLQPLAQGAITDEMLAKIATGLAAIK